jgi:hypothetical protein
MKYKFGVFFAVIIILSATFVLAMSMRLNVYLNDVSGSGAEAVARVTGAERGGLDRVNVAMRVTDLQPVDGRVFEVWFVDEDSGYKLSLGGFNTNSRGRANFRFRQHLVNAIIYDKILITSEPRHDSDPNPDEVLLVGDLFEDEEDNEVELKADLDGDQEVPPVVTGASGSGEFVLNKDANTLNFEIAYENLEGVETAAHIHGFSGPGVDSGVLFTLPVGSPKIGVWSFDEAQEQSILDGMTYVNIHSDLHPGGEIRGQIVSD